LEIKAAQEVQAGAGDGAALGSGGSIDEAHVLMNIYD
jgi:hypothetical protein